MPIARPFRAIRPAPNLVHLIVSRSYISYDDSSLSQKLASNPFSFIHVINPDHGSEKASKAGSRSLFKKVREKYLEFYSEGYFVQDEKPGYYVYRQCEGDKEFVGIICATSSKDYEEGRIKRHELTLTKREKMFTDYLRTTGINAEPVLLTYPDNPEIQEITERVTRRNPIYDFSTSDRMRHSLWAIDSTEEIALVRDAFARIDAFYIADGHHRSASSARLSAEENGGEQRTESPHDYFMSYLIPASQMRIEAFHRLIKLDGPMDKQKVLAQLAGDFELEALDEPQLPSEKGEMCINLQGDWYRLHLREASPDVLDVQICSERIIEPVFGISDLRSDKRISFLNGARGLEVLSDAVASGRADVAIALFPVQVGEMLAIADKGEVMPPKSTWVEPKLRSAMTIYSLTKD